MNPPDSPYDAVIIGGGPAGATAAIVLARAGKRAIVLERARFPRFHIGESLLPRNYPLIQDLGLEAIINRLPHVPKYGAEFVMGDRTEGQQFTFDQGLVPGSPTLNVERSGFDAALLNAARDAGVEVHESVGVKKILRLEDGNVAVATDSREIRGRYLLDASGQATVVARHLGTRVGYDDPQLKKVAYFAHFEDVKRRPGRDGGNPVIVMCEEGWFWLIPLNERRTSIGLVMNAGIAKQIGVPAGQMLAWGIARCPAVRERMTQATGPETNTVAADFSYVCRPFAGPGYFLCGDAAAFLDPVFSSGVCLGMMSGRQAAEHVIAILDGKEQPAAARKTYRKFVESCTGVFFRLIRQYYDHSFRELFLNGRGPHQVHGAVLSILAGQVFPKPIFALRWRLRLFEVFVRLNRVLPLVPRRPRFSLLSQSAPTDVLTEMTAAAPAAS